VIIVHAVIRQIVVCCTDGWVVVLLDWISTIQCWFQQVTKAAICTSDAAETSHWLATSGTGTSCAWQQRLSILHTYSLWTRRGINRACYRYHWDLLVATEIEQ